MEKESEKFRFYLNGNSDDDRTNRWRVNCKKCNNWFEPPTTMLAVQTVFCRCGTKENVNYNKLNLIK